MVRMDDQSIEQLRVWLTSRTSTPLNHEAYLAVLKGKIISEIIWDSPDKLMLNTIGFTDDSCLRFRIKEGKVRIEYETAYDRFGIE